MNWNFDISHESFFLKTKSFHGYKKLDLVTLILVFGLIIKNSNFGYIFWMVSTRILIFYMSLSFEWQDLSMGTNRFDLVKLTFALDLLNEKFNLGYIFWMVCTRTLIFHMRVCCVKSFQWVSTGLTLWPWRLCLTSLLKTLTLAVSFEWYVLRLWYFTWSVPWDKTLPRYQQIWPWP
jgi:hypothetical protein